MKNQYRTGVGIDIGIRNFAICIIKWQSKTKWYLEWTNNIDTTINMRDSCPIISMKIKHMLNTILINYRDMIYDVVIEKQPRKRTIMEKIMMATIDWFSMIYMEKKNPNLNITLRRSTDKFRIKKNLKYPRGKKNYSYRKNMSINLGIECLKDNRNIYKHDNERWANVINEFKSKKDDIYDALLLILLYYGFEL